MERKVASKSNKQANKASRAQRGPRGQPRISTSMARGVTTTVIRHREFATDIYGQALFTNVGYAINPGKSNIFPWLSTVALSYERYRFRRLVFEFRSMYGSAVASTNATLGTVVMAMNYDVADASFVNKAQMESYEGSVSAAPNMNQRFVADVSPQRAAVREYYTRAQNAVIAGTDARFFDIGSFQIATVGQQATAVVGELWIDYEVELIQPRVPVPIGSNVPTWKGTITPTTGSLFAAATPAAATTLQIATPTLQRLQIYQPGRYVIVLRIAMPPGQSATYGAGSVTSSSASNTVNPGSSFGVYTSGDGTSSWAQMTSVDVVDVTGYFAWTNVVLTTGASAADLLITQISQVIPY
jgi:hypothetical protein